MSRHTPGPWEAIKGIQFFKVVTADCSMVADCGSVSAPTYRDEFEANSFLIAAAPMQHDLLVALAACQSDNKPVREWAQKYGVDLGNATNGRVLDKAIAAAISLAERGAE